MQPHVFKDETLGALSHLEPTEALTEAGSTLEGLSCVEAQKRLQSFGPNLVTRQQRTTILGELWGRLYNPLNALLLTLTASSYLLGDLRAATVILTMVVLAVATAFVQEHRSNEAAARLRAMVHTRASVRRTPAPTGDPFTEVTLESLVPGDVVRLSAGDMIPADLRLLEAKDLFINQSALTGEAMPTEKFAHAATKATDDWSCCTHDPPGAIPAEHF